MADVKRRLILMASLVATCACASGPYVPKGPPPEYEDLPVAGPPAPAVSATAVSASPPHDPKVSDAAAD
jgi:hypothetical protein